MFDFWEYIDEKERKEIAKQIASNIKKAIKEIDWKKVILENMDLEDLTTVVKDTLVGIMERSETIEKVLADTFGELVRKIFREGGEKDG